MRGGCSSPRRVCAATCGPVPPRPEWRRAVVEARGRRTTFPGVSSFRDLSRPFRSGRRALGAALLTGTLAASRARSAAASPGSDPGMAAEILVEAASLPKLYAILLARDGALLLERAFRGPGLDRPANVKSASKSVISALVGAAIARGVLSGLDQRVAPLLGNRVPPGADPQVREITIGHLVHARRAGAHLGRQLRRFRRQPRLSALRAVSPLRE